MAPRRITIVEAVGLVLGVRFIMLFLGDLRFQLYDQHDLFDDCNTTTHRTEGRLWVCGWSFGRLASSLFPDYPPVGRLTMDQRCDFQSNDLALVGLHGPCPATNQWLHRYFPGRILFVNGESFGEARSQNSFQIGLLPDSKRSVRVFYAAIVLMGNCPAHAWRKILLPHHKPVNTQQHFLLYAQSHCVNYREEAFGRLSHLGEAHIGGKCNGTHTAPTVERVHVDGRNNWLNNEQQFNNYRFCLVMENKNIPGYITEKILMAFLGGCVPVYFGTGEIFEVFNKDAFVFYDINNPEPALKYVSYLERNRTAYQHVLKQPILANGNETIRQFFSLSDEVGVGVLKAKIRSTMGLDG